MVSRRLARPGGRKVAPMLEYVPFALVGGMTAYILALPNKGQK